MTDDTKKYEIVKTNSIIYGGKILYRIKALKSFVTADGGVALKGKLGGFIESENNLSQKGNCWIFNEAKVFGCAKILDNAVIRKNAQIFGNAVIGGNAYVDDDAYICGNSRISGCAKIFNTAVIYRNAKVFDNAKIFGEARVYDNAEIKGDVFIYGNTLVCGTAKISGDKKIKTGKYIVKSLNVDETLNEIKPVCEKIDFASKAVKSNFPVEKSYIENLISQFAEYSELTDFFHIHGIIGLTFKELEIYNLLLQGKANVETLKK